MSTWRDLKPVPEAKLRLAILGFQVDTSLQVGILNAALKSMDVPYKAIPIEVNGEEFTDCVNHLAACHFKGALIANPHKVAAARMAKDYYVVRNSVGLANVLNFDQGIFGRNTEVSSVSHAVDGIEPGRALVLGAGQSARSVIMGLIECGWQVRVWNRSAMKSRLLQAAFNRYGKFDLATEPDPSGCRLVVNATPVGLKIGEKLPLVWKHVIPKTTFIDLVYRNVATEFCRSARSMGLKAIDGRELIVDQAAQALEWWAPEEKVDREAMLIAAKLPSVPQKPY